MPCGKITHATRVTTAGSDVDIQRTSARISTRCLIFQKDFSVFTLGPEASVRADRWRLRHLDAKFQQQQQRASEDVRPEDGGSEDHLSTDGNRNSQGLLRNPYRLLLPQDGDSSESPLRFSGDLWRASEGVISKEQILQVSGFRAEAWIRRKSFKILHVKISYPSVQHVKAHGVMVVFKFGCTVFFQPETKSPKRRGQPTATSNGSDAASDPQPAGPTEKAAEAAVAAAHASSTGAFAMTAAAAATAAVRTAEEERKAAAVAARREAHEAGR